MPVRNMNDSPLTEESIGRIEVAPEVIATIAYHATLNVPGVAKTGIPPAGFFRRATVRHEGVVLQIEGNNLVFDIYVWLQSDVNMMETSRALQQAVIEAIDHMVGVPVNAVNVHVENVASERPAKSS